MADRRSRCGLRSSATPGAKDWYANGILPAVGAVRYVNFPLTEQFPSDAIMALFPGFVPARWDSATNAIVAKQPPAVVRTRQGWLWAKAWIDEMTERDGPEYVQRHYLSAQDASVAGGV